MPGTPYLDHPGPIAMAHRGFSPEGLENSMTAFRAAVALGIRYLETDVHATSDGVLLAFHDHVLDRVTDSTGRVSEMTWEQVRTARIGGVEPIPRLEEALEELPDVRFNIDVKDANGVQPLVELVNRTGVHDRVLVTSFSERRREAALDGIIGPVATSASATGVAAFLGAARLGLRGAALRWAAQGVDCLQTSVSAGGVPVVTARTVDAAHSADLQVHVWTVNERAEMERLLDLGVDGIITDRVDTLIDVLRDRGQWEG